VLSRQRGDLLALSRANQVRVYELRIIRNGRLPMSTMTMRARPRVDLIGRSAEIVALKK
jgi:hypothetical protein